LEPIPTRQSMKRRTKNTPGKVPVRTPHEELAREAAEWDARTRTPRGFREAPEAVPQAASSESISLRMPARLLEVIRLFAERERVGYQVLIKRWLDDRIRFEREQLSERRRGRGKSSAPSFPLEDRPETDGPHYRSVH
jgi:hypothetical protein